MHLRERLSEFLAIQKQVPPLRDCCASHSNRSGRDDKFRSGRQFGRDHNSGRDHNLTESKVP